MPSVRTNGPMHVGDATPQPIYCSDLNPTGLVRAGMCVYRVTRGSTYSNNPVPIAPGSGSDYGYWPQMGGGIFYTSLNNFAETITWRTKITVASSLSVYFNMRVNEAVSIYVDGNFQYSTYGSNAVQCGTGYTFSAGTHTLDITYSGDGSGNDDHFTVFPWVPFANGSVSSAITSFIPG